MPGAKKKKRQEKCSNKGLYKTTQERSRNAWLYGRGAQEDYLDWKEITGSE